MCKRIVIMAGGTGGHVFPALAVADFLQQRGWQVSWIGTKKGLESRVVPEKGIAIDYLAVNGLRGKGGGALLRMPFMVLNACWQARRILRQRQPDVVLGMGGFVAGPAGIMAWLLGIPLLIHEQNKVVGTTNKLLAIVATEVLEAFPQSFKPSKKAVFTGNPLRAAFVNYDFSNPVPRSGALKIMVLGGSLGAQCLNAVLPDAIHALNKFKECSELGNIEVLHQTGTVMREQVSEAYKKYAIHAEVVEFLEDMVAAYAWADMIICRAGAMTISEISAMGLPAILVPYPYAIDNHQQANAHYLLEVNAAVVLPQSVLTPVSLASQMIKVFGALEAMQKQSRKCAKLEATQLVAEKCIERAL